MKVKFVNCTPHPINILNENNEVILSLPKGEVIPRCSQNTTLVGKVNDVRITETTFGEVENLPNAQEGTFLIVSRLVLAACAERSDLLVPNELVRDGQGHIIGAKSLSRN